MIFQDKDSKRQSDFKKLTDTEITQHSARIQNAHGKLGGGKNAFFERDLKFWLADKAVKVLTNPYTKRLLMLCLK